MQRAWKLQVTNGSYPRACRGCPPPLSPPGACCLQRTAGLRCLHTHSHMPHSAQVCKLLAKNAWKQVQAMAKAATASHPVRSAAQQAVNLRQSLIDTLGLAATLEECTRCPPRSLYAPLQLPAPPFHPWHHR